MQTYLGDSMKLPQQVETLLFVYKHVYKQNIHLAGGAVRDYITQYWKDAQIADYDLFLESQNAQIEIDELRILADRLKLDFQILSSCSANISNELDQYGYPWVTVRLSSTDIQIDVIISDMSIEKHIDRFSCNASKVYMDENFKIVTTDEFDEWIRTGVLKFITDVDAKYEAKIRKRFE